MRRWLLLLLLAVLPLQFASAAAASYCAHEAGVAKHFGHHEHQHEKGSQEAGSQAGSALGGDADCGYCHLGAAHPLLQSFVSSASRLQVAPAAGPLPSFGSRDPDSLERPNWAALA